MSIAASTLRVAQLGELLLPARVTSEPLKTGSSIDCGSTKSLNQPALAADADLLGRAPDTTPCTRTSCGTARSLTLKPELLELRLGDLRPATCPGRRWRPRAELVVARVLARRVAGLPDVLRAQRPCRRRVREEVEPRALEPPACSNPGMPGGRKCVAMSPMNSPPRAARAASRSKPAMTALRTLMLSNGLFVVFSGSSGSRRSAPATNWSLISRHRVAQSRPAGWLSSAMCEPVRTCRAATRVGLVGLHAILSRYAGR